MLSARDLGQPGFYSAADALDLDSPQGSAVSCAYPLHPYAYDPSYTPSRPSSSNTTLLRGPLPYAPAAIPPARLTERNLARASPNSHPASHPRLIEQPPSPPSHGNTSVNIATAFREAAARAAMPPRRARPARTAETDTDAEPQKESQSTAGANRRRRAPSTAPSVAPSEAPSERRRSLRSASRAPSEGRSSASPSKRRSASKPDVQSIAEDEESEGVSSQEEDEDEEYGARGSKRVRSEDQDQEEEGGAGRSSKRAREDDEEAGETVARFHLRAPSSSPSIDEDEHSHSFGHEGESSRDFHSHSNGQSFASARGTNQSYSYDYAAEESLVRQLEDRQSNGEAIVAEASGSTSYRSAAGSPSKKQKGEWLARNIPDSSPSNPFPAAAEGAEGETTPSSARKRKPRSSIDKTYRPAAEEEEESSSDIDEGRDTSKKWNKSQLRFGTVVDGEKKRRRSSGRGRGRGRRRRGARATTESPLRREVDDERSESASAWGGAEGSLGGQDDQQEDPPQDNYDFPPPDYDVYAEPPPAPHRAPSAPAPVPMPPPPAPAPRAFPPPADPPAPPPSTPRPSLLSRLFRFVALIVYVPLVLLFNLFRSALSPVFSRRPAVRIPLLLLGTLGLLAALRTSDSSLFSRSPQPYQGFDIPPGDLKDLLDRIALSDAANLDARKGFEATSQTLTQAVTQLRSGLKVVEGGLADVRRDTSENVRLARKGDEALQDSLASLRRDVVALKGRVGGLDDRSRTNSARLGKLDGGFGEMQAEVDRLGARIKEVAEATARAADAAGLATEVVKQVEAHLPRYVAVRRNPKTGELDIDPAFWTAMKGVFAVKGTTSSSSPSEAAAPPSWDAFLASNEASLRRWLDGERHRVLDKDDFVELLDSKIRTLKDEFEARANENVRAIGEEVLGKVVKLQEREREAAGSTGWFGGKKQSQSITTPDGKNVTELIAQLVETALARYSKDVLARPDYALFSAGARIVPSHTTPTYTVRPASLAQRLVGKLLGSSVVRGRPPVTALHPDLSVGMCWPFAGAHGQLGIALARRIVVSDITLDHAPRETSLDRTGAPREVEVWAVVDTEEGRRKARELAEAEAAQEEEDADPRPIPPTKDHVLLASFTYDLDSPRHIQTFPVRPAVRDAGIETGMVVVRVLSNHGNPHHTCLYRVRAHAALAEE